MEKINLNTSPSLILSATIGSVFELDDNLFILGGKDKVYLTLLNTDSSQWHKDKEGKSDWRHVYNKAGSALMTRQEMCDMIEFGNYFVE